MALALTVTVGVAPVRAQDSLFRQPPVPAYVEGRIVTPGPEQETPVPNVMVTVHRIGSEGGAPLDSARTDARGRYRVNFTRFGDEQAVYIAAVVYRDIAYFSPPLRGEVTKGDAGVITVFETSTRLVPFTIQGHHVVVSKPGDGGTRKIVEVFELSNDTMVTIVPKDSVSAVWSTAFPPGATGFKSGQGDVGGDALIQRDGRVLVLAPFGPGVKQLSYSYALDDGDFPLRIKTERQTGVFEVLLEEDGAQARGSTLASSGVVTTDGRNFKRFLSPGILAGEEIRIDVPSAAFLTRTRVLAVLALLIGAAMAAALARALLSRSARARVVVHETPRRSEALVAALALLDERHEAGDASLSAEAYAAERASLKAALAAALAADESQHDQT